MFGQVPEFSEIYNGAKGVREKRRMDKMRASELGINDVVIAEATITRWDSSSKGEQNTARPARREWREWRVELRLESLTFIREGPRDIVSNTGVPAGITL